MSHVPPKISFCSSREYYDEETGLWNPRDEGYFAGSLQINLFGSAKQYAKLAEFFLWVAEKMPDDDHHHYEVNSIVGETRLHIILRKGEYPEYIAEDE